MLSTENYRLDLEKLKSLPLDPKILEAFSKVLVLSPSADSNEKSNVVTHFSHPENVVISRFSINSTQSVNQDGFNEDNSFLVSNLDEESDKEVEEFLSAVWAEKETDVQIKSIWSTISEDEVKVRGRFNNKRMDKFAVTQQQAVSREIAKGGRLQMDEIYNQLEELETERRSHEAEIGIPSVPFNPRVRGQFDVSGLSEMMVSVFQQHELLKNCIRIMEEMRLEAETRAISLSPIDFRAMVLELCYNNKEKADALRRKFDLALIYLYKDWENKFYAVHRVIFPSNPAESSIKLDLMPYLLKELYDVVRFSRVALFVVRMRYNEVLYRVAQMVEYENSDLAAAERRRVAALEASESEASAIQN